MRSAKARDLAHRLGTVFQVATMVGSSISTEMSASRSSKTIPDSSWAKRFIAIAINWDINLRALEVSSSSCRLAVDFVAETVLEDGIPWDAAVELLP
ncbi:hypothetical protein HFO98_04750 [Rhizobium leguminosarum]|uniref:hypothetical protein n=1 Tax=Rhizobium leguminosarum TaxID=384 RepID=UPI001C966A8A|nr:hypothetical protein [Rhizobium leguminosarum]